MDGIDSQAIHLNHRDVTVAAVAIAPYKKFAAYRERMGWSFSVYSSAGSDFNFDYHVSFTPEQMKDGKADYNYRVDPVFMSESPGVSVFLREGGKIYHTYSAYARGARHAERRVQLPRPSCRRVANEGPMGMMDWLRRRERVSGVTLMATSMAAMMLPTRRRFSWRTAAARGAQGRPPPWWRSNVAVWATFGVAAYLVMSRVMLPSGLWVAAGAVLVAAFYALAPWSRRGRAPMPGDVPRGRRRPDQQRPDLRGQLHRLQRRR